MGYILLYLVIYFYWLAPKSLNLGHSLSNTSALDWSGPGTGHRFIEYDNRRSGHSQPRISGDTISSEFDSLGASDYRRFDYHFFIHDRLPYCHRADRSPEFQMGNIPAWWTYRSNCIFTCSSSDFEETHQNLIRIIKLMNTYYNISYPRNFFNSYRNAYIVA